MRRTSQILISSSSILVGARVANNGKVQACQEACGAVVSAINSKAHSWDSNPGPPETMFVALSACGRKTPRLSSLSEVAVLVAHANSIQTQDEGREIQTPNLLIWSQTRYRCATESAYFKR